MTPERTKLSHRLHLLLGWGVFSVALLTYLLTLEPTVSFWDCPEYTAVAWGLQPGHPPGNPMWMLAARFFMNFAPEPAYAPLMAGVLSAVCSALTILFTYLATVLLAKWLCPPRQGNTYSLRRSLLCDACGIVGALALCWSDTFWFSAVEAEVYAFSSLTTALLFWLILVWCEQVGKPHADRWLIAVAYVLGLSIGVHELNLLCLPALLLVVAFRMKGYLSKRKILLIIMVAIAAIALVLYGMIPGFLSLAGRAEYFAVNTLGLPYHWGAVAWWILALGLTMGGVASIHIQGNRCERMWSIGLCTLAVGVNGLFFFSGNVPLGLCLTLLAGLYTAWRSWKGHLSLRRIRIAMWCMAMLLLGFSSYAGIIVRSAANPPLNTGVPADIFAFQRYFAREQYGKSPLVYGPTYMAKPQRMRSWTKTDSGPAPLFNLYRTVNPRPHLTRALPGMKHRPRSGYATSADSAANAKALNAGRGYVLTSYGYDLAYPPEMCMWFPRMHSQSPYDVAGYPGWSGADSTSMTRLEKVTWAVDSAGNAVDWPGAPSQVQLRPTYMQNLQYLAVYQLGYMYWRYFLWNFVGRQNDYPGHGEPDCGNFITGIDALDDAMLDNCSAAPPEISSGNKGRNVYWFLPLLLGLVGILTQCTSGVRGRRQALVLTVLFVVTGIAIVFYLNQGPAQARDRDYSFAGSFYAWTMWMGLGVMGVYRIGCKLLPRVRKRWVAAGCGLLCVCVPLQMLSQTADDHDRSGRTVARDMGMAQLTSLKPRALLFAAEDNYLFPIIYLQNVEGMRPDVRMLSMPYMVTDWYRSQLSLPLRDGSRVDVTGPEGPFASGQLANVQLGSDMEWTEALPALKKMYADAVKRTDGGYVKLPTPRLFIAMGKDTIRLDLGKTSSGRTSYLRSDQLLALDLIATNAASPNPRPVYVVSAVANGLFAGQLQPYLSQTGTVSELLPSKPGLDATRTADLALTRWHYGGAAKKGVYFDPVAAHNLSVLRRSVIESALTLAADPETAGEAVELLTLTEREMPAVTAPYEAVYRPLPTPHFTTEGLMAARAWGLAAETLNRKDLREKDRQTRMAELTRIYLYRRWRDSLRPAYRPYVSYRVENLLKATD